MKIIDVKGLSQADPYVIKHGGKFYMYCTGVYGVDCYAGDSLSDNWVYLGNVFSVDGQKEYWAPSVIEDNGTFYMYYSSMPSGSDDVHTQQIRLAVCNRPDGQFEYVCDVLPPFSIDPHVVRNDDGLYMFYSVNRYEGERVGTYIVCDKMLGFSQMANEPESVVEPTRDEEIFQKDRFVKGQHWHTIEGAFYFKQDGYHYCMYSGNCYEKPTYHIGYAVCKSESDKLNKLNFTKHVTQNFCQLISTHEVETSTGHNSLINIDGQYYVVYHGRDISADMSQQPRTARICKLFAKDGILTVERI